MDRWMHQLLAWLDNDTQPCRAYVVSFQHKQNCHNAKQHQHTLGQLSDGGIITPHKHTCHLNFQNCSHLATALCLNVSLRVVFDLLQLDFAHTFRLLTMMVLIPLAAVLNSTSTKENVPYIIEVQNNWSSGSLCFCWIQEYSTQLKWGKINK